LGFYSSIFISFFFFLATFAQPHVSSCTLYFKKGSVRCFLDKYPNVFGVIINMKLSINEWPQYDHHDDTFL